MKGKVTAKSEVFPEHAWRHETSAPARTVSTTTHVSAVNQYLGWADDGFI